MSNSGKRQTLLEDDEREAKRTKLEDGHLGGSVAARSSDQSRAVSTSHIDLTKDDDECMNDVPPNTTQPKLPSTVLDLIDRLNKSTSGKTGIRANSETPESGTTTPGSDQSSPRAHRTATPAATGTRDEASVVAAYDVCFGLLCVQVTATGKIEVPPECVPVTLKFDKEYLKVYLVGDDKCVAVKLSHALFRLVTEFAVTLTATMCGKQTKTVGNRDINESGPRTMFGARFCRLRVVVYGFYEQKDAVARVLAKENLFLQHPSRAEFDEGAKYFNPQYLLAPNEDMPPLEKLSISTCCVAGQAGSRSLLREYERNQILKIFDTANRSGEAMARVEPSPRLGTKLKSHQIEALTMMVEKEAGIYDRAQFPTIWVPFTSSNGQTRYQNLVTRRFETSRPPPIGGGILADEMGLGKTLSSLSLICHSLDAMDRNPDLSKELPRATLIITPKSTIYGWEKQTRTHILPEKVRWMTYHGSRRHEVGHAMIGNDIVLTTYDTLRSDRSKGGPLLNQNWERIILDEAHRIRNRHSKTFHDVCAVRANHRWCLTGTPLQNCLDDFGALLTFANIHPFGEQTAFENYVTRPIKDRKKNGMELLRKVVAATCLRRTKTDHALTLNLPQKLERIEQVTMPDGDRKMYEFFKRFSFVTAAEGNNSMSMASTDILILISMLRLICDHGEALLPETAVKAWRGRDSALLTVNMLESGTRRCVSCDRVVEDLGTLESAVEELTCGHVLCESCVMKSQRLESQPTCSQCDPTEVGPPSTSAKNSLASPRRGLASPLKPQYPPSAKVQALLCNITNGQTWSGRSDNPLKHVVFSYWTKMLDLIETALKEKGIQFCRIDGRSSLSQRKNALERFGKDSEYRIMLASIGAAGEGIDLTAANSVHIVEPQWNPMAEAQAIDRVHRIGQQRDVEVIRYIVSDSIETYVQWVQMDKLRLIKETLSPPEQKTEKVAETRWKKLLAYLR